MKTEQNYYFYMAFRTFYDDLDEIIFEKISTYMYNYKDVIMKPLMNTLDSFGYDLMSTIKIDFKYNFGRFFFIFNGEELNKEQKKQLDITLENAVNDWNLYFKTFLIKELNIQKDQIVDANLLHYDSNNGLIKA